MEILLYAVFIVACFVLIAAVLLQPGKADAGALFTSSISSTAFGPRGTQTLLAKITIGAASLFLLLSLLLSLPGVTGPRSVVQGDEDAPITAPTQQQPQQSAPAPATQTNTEAGAATTVQPQAAPTTQTAAPASNQNAGAPQP